jgi:cell division protein FtsL
MNIRILINFLCVAVLAIGVYLVKYSVQDVQREVVSLKTELAKEKESLHLLNAEWAYLNRPDRLRQLADRHLDLVPLDTKTIGEVSVLPAAVPASEAAVPQSSMVREVSLQGVAR